jgi:uncharacterized membrane protein YtjA (UPF0391 family)
MRIDNYIFSGVRVLSSASAGAAKTLFAVFISIIITVPLYAIFPRNWIHLPIFLWAGFIGIYWTHKTGKASGESTSGHKVSLGAAILTWMLIAGVIYSDPRLWAGELAFKGLMITGAIFLGCRYILVPVFLPITAGEEEDEEYEFDDEEDDDHEPESVEEEKVESPLQQSEPT